MTDLERGHKENKDYCQSLRERQLVIENKLESDSKLRNDLIEVEKYILTIVRTPGLVTRLSVGKKSRFAHANPRWYKLRDTSCLQKTKRYVRRIHPLNSTATKIVKTAVSRDQRF